MQEYLQETLFLDFNNSVFETFLSKIDETKPQKELAIDLYFLARDSFIYDPYHLNIRSEGLIASKLIGKKRAWCVEKSIVLATMARKFNIPSRLGYAIVINHIGVEKLMNYLRRAEIVFHGYVELYIEGKWVKCTPSFDRTTCRLANVSSLDWDGSTDSIFQEFEKGKQFMEYTHYYGSFQDVPIELMNAEMKKYYPHLFEEQYLSKEFSFLHV